MVPQDKTWHQNYFEAVGYDIVDTFTNFDQFRFVVQKLLPGWYCH